uniref:Heptahelical transmembrane protein ADIPOR1 n=1 Tax=Oryza meridionalis TaxID=40149 RepID=A0A0E0E491_9ORYZ
MGEEAAMATMESAYHELAPAAAPAPAKGGGGGGGSKKKRKQQKREEKRKECRLVSYHELPDYMKENEFILDYYRSEWPILNALLSLFSWHNETINIWTHLLGFVLFFGLTVLHLGQYFPQVADFIGHLSWPISKVAENVSSNIGDVLSGAASFMQASPASSGGAMAAAWPATAAAATTTRWPFFVFLAGAMFCLLSSAACHLLSCHSHRLNLFLIRLDYTGIAVMIVVSFFPPIYYIFQCEPRWQVVYLSAITGAGVATVYALMSPRLSAARYRAHRALLFVAMGLSGVVPAAHAVAVNWHEPRRNVTLAYEGAMAASYLAGTAFYLTRVPERWRPGMFDLCGHSHQIFHALVIAGALAHYAAAIVFIQARDEMGCPAP